MRRFFLYRKSDPTGNSGTGRVAEGCCFSDGSCVIRWTNTVLNVASTVVYSSVEDARRVHGHGGLTEIEWADSLKVGDFVVLNVIDGFGGYGRVVGIRNEPNSRWQVTMEPPHENQLFWAHDFEIEAIDEAARREAKN